MPVIDSECRRKVLHNDCSERKSLMPDLFLLFNHTITPAQKNQARQKLAVTNIVVPPAEISELWGALPAADKALLPCLQPVIAWLDQHAVKGDYVLIQGDFGACYLLVRHALEKGYIPVYATTERQAVEKGLEDGGVELTHTFRHVCFRRYGQ